LKRRNSSIKLLIREFIYECESRILLCDVPQGWGAGHKLNHHLFRLGEVVQVCF
jgi:hypothetical protein